MNLARELAESNDEQLREKLAGAQPASSTWFGVTAEIQRRQLIAVNSVLERSEEQTRGLGQTMRELREIAEAQKRFAAKLDGQTSMLIRLTWGLVVLSIALLAVAIVQTRVMFKQDAEAHAEHIDLRQP
jgi:hypothetical protein